MLARFSSFAIWALVAATVLFWSLRLFVRSPAAPVYAVAVDNGAAVRGDLTRLLGSAPAPVAGRPPAPPEASARFKLLGIMAPRPNASDRQGVALIAVDGKPARAFTVGTSLDEQLVLQSVSLRSAAIGPARGQSELILEMPTLPSAATGSLAPPTGVPVPPARFVPTMVPAFPAQTLPAQNVPLSGQGGMVPSQMQVRPNQPVSPD